MVGTAGRLNENICGVKAKGDESEIVKNELITQLGTKFYELSW